MQTDPTTGLTCSACGADNASGADFCWQCFAPFHRVAPARPAAPPTAGPTWMSSRQPVAGPTVKKRRSYRTLIIAAVVVVGGLAAYGSASRTHFSIPESIDGVPRMHDVTSQRFEAAVAKWGEESGGLSLQGAAYGNGVTPDFAVGAADDPVKNDPDDILRTTAGSWPPTAERRPTRSR